ncbi:type III pantothenate kinase [Denitratisoma sp. agr-D3]
MRLCLDCGNTRIKWGLHDGRQWLAHGAVASTEPEHLDEALADLPPPDLVVGCNVAGPAVAAAITARFPAIQWNTAQSAQAGVSNGYETPERLGADRWAALIGARHLHHGASLVVNAGTATTIDLLDADGRFLGGLILPGLDLMARALATHTAQLPANPGHYAEVPRNTEDAITAGTLHATLGALSRMAERLAQCGHPPICLLAGGAAPRLLPHVSLPLRHEPLLVLHGLSRVPPSTLP